VTRDPDHRPQLRHGRELRGLDHGQDEVLLDLVTSANIACGFHAGDPATMLRTVRCAAAKGVAIGAHPSLPDLQASGAAAWPSRLTKPAG